MSDATISYWDKRALGVQVGSLWKHVGLGYVSRVTSCNGRAVRYERVDGRVPFSLSRAAFVQTYHPMRPGWTMFESEGDMHEAITGHRSEVLDGPQRSVR